MKTTKEEILQISLKLFSENGYEAVSISQISDELGITKGALYKHFENKRAIFDSIIKRMFELDAQRANECEVPVEKIEENSGSYSKTQVHSLCNFTKEQFLFWTEDEFASRFRKMLTLEQFRNDEMKKLYQDVVTSGPVFYTIDLMKEMLASKKLNQKAQKIGVEGLAVMLFSPLHLLIQMSDGGEDKNHLLKILENVVNDFENRFIEK